MFDPTSLPSTSQVSDPPIRQEWLAEFEAAAPHPLAQSFRRAFIRTSKPVLDDTRCRLFVSLAEYQHECEENMPDGLSMSAFEYRQVEKSATPCKEGRAVPFHWEVWRVL